jgi:glycerate kinase
VTLLSGAVDPEALPQLSALFSGCFALPDGPLTLAESIARAAALIADRTEQTARLVRGAREAG